MSLEKDITEIRKALKAVNEGSTGIPYNVKLRRSRGGTSLQGYFPEGTRYSDLVKVFGKPNASGDGYKVDAEWSGTIDGVTFTIYNYKTGKNYNGEEGQAVEEITDWHIGGDGTDKDLVRALIDYFEGKLGR